MLTRDNQIRIDYRATTDKDTVVNLTNHSYFNLAGQAGGSVERQLIEIAASRFTPTDETSIPTGQLASVAGTPMDLRQLTPIGAHLRDAYPQLVTAHGYDQNWVLDQAASRRRRLPRAPMIRRRGASSSCTRRSRGCSSIRPTD